MTELWYDIKGFEGYYQVSNTGRVKSLSRRVIHARSKSLKRNEKILSFQTAGKYLTVSLCKNSIITRILVHRLVAQTFIPNPDNKQFVNHKDGNPCNNHFDNLEWCTASENKLHSHYVLNKNVMPIKATCIKTNVSYFYKSIRAAERELNISNSSISGVVNGIRKTAGGFKFEKQ